MKVKTSELAAATGGQLIGNDVTFSGATSDGREVQNGQLFVPIRGSRNGHDYIAQAISAGAVAYLTDRRVVKGATAIKVSDTVKALGVLGSLVRSRLPNYVIGITGSCGKTSTKDLLTHILEDLGPVTANRSSFNNEIGTPLTIANAVADTEFTIVEMGARHPGNISYLAGIARPTVGVVTNVGFAHMGTFGDLDVVARTKGELIEALPGGGTAVLNYADERVLAMGKLTKARVLTFGIDNADVYASRVQLDRQLKPSFRLHTPDGSAPVHMNVRGRHQVINAVAGAAAAYAVGARMEHMVLGLEKAVLSPNRMELITIGGGAVILNDSYNANPTSMAAALSALHSYEASGRKIAVLGEMAELGKASRDQHELIAEQARVMGIELITVQAPEYGPKTHKDVKKAAKALGRLHPGDVVLVKGSRVAEMETLIPLLA